MRMMDQETAKHIAQLRHEARVKAGDVHDHHHRAINAGVCVFNEPAYLDAMKKLRDLTRQIQVIIDQHR